jgi:hypothetical protein
MVGLVVAIGNNWSADRLQNSSFHVMWPLAVAIVGFVVAAASLNTGERYFAMILMVGGRHGANAVLLAWTQKTMIRPRIKRASAVAFVNAFGDCRGSSRRICIRIARSHGMYSPCLRTQGSRWGLLFSRCLCGLSC